MRLVDMDMNAVVDSLKSRPTNKADTTPRPTRAEAEAAVRTLIAWSGDDPRREGLLETPGRVVRALLVAVVVLAALVPTAEGRIGARRMPREWAGQRYIGGAVQHC